MDAPFWEELLRVLLALVASAAGIALAIGWHRSKAYPASPLLAYLATTTLVYAAWRWVIVVIGLMLEAENDWALEIEPYIRSTGNVLLLLVMLALLLISYFHARRLR